MINSFSANLMVADVTKSIEFYVDVIGATIAFTVDAEKNSLNEAVIDNTIFGSMRVGQTELMLQERQNLIADAPAAFSDEDTPGGSLSLYFRVDNVDEVAEQIAAATPEIEVVKPMELTWYGMKEIWIKDPDGYVVTAGTPEGPPPAS